MHPVNGTSLTTFQSSRTQLGFRSQGHRADQAAHKHHDHVESSHGRRHAAQIFRQEMIQSLKIHFRSEFKLSQYSVSPYRSSESAEGVAAEVLTTARTIAEQSPDEPPKTLAQVRKSVDQAVSASQEIVNTNEGAATLAVADGLIKRGLDALESDARLISASSLFVESTSKQRSTIQIRTQEGDIVKFDLRRVDRFSASDVAVQTESGAASLTEVSVSSRSRLILKIDGDLNDVELEAIRNVFAQAEQLAEEFFSGDISAALEIIAGLEFDSSQLARVSMKFRSSERLSLAQTILQSAPAAQAVESTTPSATSTVATPTDSPAAPLSAPSPAATVAAPTSSTPEVETATVAAEDTPGPTGLLSGFASLLNYLGMIADYLEQTIEQFNDFLLQGAPGVGIRFEFSESLRLDILRVVMVETAPQPGENEEEASGSAIRQLAEESGSD